MKSLVTGGAGFIGSHIVDTLLDAGHEVIVLDNEYSDNEKFNWNDKVENHVVDICDYESSRKYYDGVDYVFHAAAEARIGPAIANPINAVNINCIGTCTVLQCAREAGVKKVMYSSTSSAYGLNDPPNTEDQPEDCLNPYSVSKIAGEKICKMYTDLFDLPTVIFRYFNVFGERAPTKGQYAPVIGIFMRQRAAGEQLTIVGDGEQRRDFVYVKDVARANVMAAISNAEPEAYGQVYNVGTGTNLSVNQIASFISEDVIYLPPRTGEARNSLANIEKIYKTFGWRPQVTVDEWIEEQMNG
jgi:UDP-glucose 4-epimerase|tara:strand:+ start:1598 stop:2497 length:900 start_codon:yes stop_codon:yes gene_type:complete